MRFRIILSNCSELHRIPAVLAFRDLPVIVFEQSFKADRDKSVTGEEVTRRPRNLTAASAKHTHKKSAWAVLGSCRCKSGSTACWILSRHLYLDLSIEKRFDDDVPERTYQSNTVHLSTSFFSFTLLYRELFKLTGTDFQIQDLCLTIAGLSEILIRVLSGEIQLRFVSADGYVIF